MRILILTLLLAFGCSHVGTTDEHYSTLGVAEAARCKDEYYPNGQLKSRECVIMKSDAFSGWSAIMEGLSKGILRILTLGIYPG